MGLLASIAPAVVGGLFSAVGANRQNKQASANADKQMAFQERMSNTAHQRQVADLKAAGINPMLSAKLGGASSPSGASAPVENVGDAAVRGASSGMSSAAAAKSLQLVDAQIDVQRSIADLNSAQSNKVRAETLTPEQYSTKWNADTSHSVASAEQSRAMTNMIGEQTKKVSADVSQVLANVDLTKANTGKVKYEIDQIQQSIRESVARIVSMGLSNEQTIQAIEKLKVDTIGSLTENERKKIGVLLDKSSLVRSRTGEILEGNKVPGSINSADFDSSAAGRATTSIGKWFNALTPFKSLVP